MMRKLIVELKEHPYPIFIEKGCVFDDETRLKEKHPSKKTFLMMDSNVKQLFGQRLETLFRNSGYETKLFCIPPGETEKSISRLEDIYRELTFFQMTRTDVLVAIGGGVVGDLCGFAAATYLRGIPYIQIPTTLLAQVDSAIGGKVAVNLPEGKNLVGSFYQPKAVLIDPYFLETLPLWEFQSGMAEVIKYACIKDAALFERLEHLGKENQRAMIMEEIEALIFSCCSCKKQLVEEDEQDCKVRMLLNFGHTLGHVLEAETQYKGYSHGEAVAIGMYQITKLSEEKGLSVKGTALRIQKLLECFQLPTEPKKEFVKKDKKLRLSLLVKDKKNRDHSLHVVLLSEIGAGYLYETDADFFKEVL